MKTDSNYKPVGGVESAALYPADAVATALFSSEGCNIKLSGEPIEIPLMEEKSRYEETLSVEHGKSYVAHQLHLVADRNDAGEWLENRFWEQSSFDGLIAVVSLCDGRRLLVGYSAQLGNEHPLQLEALSSTSGNTLHETPSVTLQLISYDTEFSAHIL